MRSAPANIAATIAPYWKALVGFILPGAVVIGSAVTDASHGGSTITGPEWITAAIACIVTAGGVYATPNRRHGGEHRREDHL